jgi:hypothetical protein
VSARRRTEELELVSARRLTEELELVSARRLTEELELVSARRLTEELEQVSAELQEASICSPGVAVGVVLAADSLSTSASGYRASLWDS